MLIFWLNLEGEQEEENKLLKVLFHTFLFQKKEISGIEWERIYDQKLVGRANPVFKA